MLLRRAKLDTVESLSKIYTRMPQHQDFIIEELLSSISKCPFKEKEFRLRNGRSVTMLSGLILMLLQNSQAAVSLPAAEENQESYLSIVRLIYV